MFCGVLASKVPTFPGHFASRSPSQSVSLKLQFEEAILSYCVSTEGTRAGSLGSRPRDPPVVLSPRRSVFTVAFREGRRLWSEPLPRCRYRARGSLLTFFFPSPNNLSMTQQCPTRLGGASALPLADAPLNSPSLSSLPSVSPRGPRVRPPSHQELFGSVGVGGEEEEEGGKGKMFVNEQL